MTTMTTAIEQSAAADSSGLRRRAFVDAARDEFFAHGYAATSMSSIAGKVGGSKTTLWSNFPSKDHLFAAVVDDIVERFGHALAIELCVDRPVPEVLRHFGTILMDTMSSQPMLSLYRLVVGEAERFPQLAETFYSKGPRIGKGRLAGWMIAKMAKGELRHGDPMLAVHQFVGLCQCRFFTQGVLGLPSEGEGSSSQYDVDTAVETFCRAWMSDVPADGSGFAPR